MDESSVLESVPTPIEVLIQIRIMLLCFRLLYAFEFQ